MSETKKFCGMCGDPIDSPRQICPDNEGNALCAPAPLMSEESLRATVRAMVNGVYYSSYYASGKAQLTLTEEGCRAYGKLAALVSLEEDERPVIDPCPECGEEATDHEVVRVVSPVMYVKCPRVPEPIALSLFRAEESAE